MSTNHQSGVTTLQIIIGLAVIALIFGLVSTFTADSNPESAQTAATEADSTESQTPLENIAQNMAENETADMMEAVEQRSADMDSLSDDMGGSMDTMDARVEADAETDVAATSESDSSPAGVTAGTFSDYSPDKLALAQNGTVVLFFHANWCPSCRGLENDINANLSQIPAGTHILKLDYDTETELKKKYGVVRQHTLVVVNADGSEVKKITGLTNTLSQVVSQL